MVSETIRNGWNWTFSVAVNRGFYVFIPHSNNSNENGEFWSSAMQPKTIVLDILFSI